MKRYLKQKSIDTRYCQFSLIFPCWWEIDHKYVKILRNTKNNLERVHLFFSYYTVYTIQLNSIQRNFIDYDNFLTHKHADI